MQIEQMAETAQFFNPIDGVKQRKSKPLVNNLLFIRKSSAPGINSIGRKTQSCMNLLQLEQSIKTSQSPSNTPQKLKKELNLELNQSSKFLKGSGSKDLPKIGSLLSFQRRTSSAKINEHSKTEANDEDCPLLSCPSILNIDRLDQTLRTLKSQFQNKKSLGQSSKQYVDSSPNLSTNDRSQNQIYFDLFSKINSESSTQKPKLNFFPKSMKEMDLEKKGYLLPNVVLPDIMKMKGKSFLKSKAQMNMINRVFKD